MAENPNKIVAQKNTLVGDEAVAAVETPFAVDDTDTTVKAQVSPPRAPESDKVAVREVFVVTDKFVLDPSSPEAVQIPDAGRGSLDLPIHGLNQPLPEDVFAEASAEADATDEA